MSRLESDVTDIRSILANLGDSVARLEAKFDATIPHLATKEQVAELPTREYLWGVVGVLITGIFGAFGVSLGAYTVFH